MTAQESQPLQRPDLGIETISPADSIMLSNEQFPWLSADLTEVNTVLVDLGGVDEPFRYGSAIGGSNSIERIASSVSEQHSINAEQGMFKALAIMLNNQTAPNVEVVPGIGENVTVYKTTKRGNDVARLFFTTFRDEQGTPTVIKLGIAGHKKQEAMVNVMRQNKNGGRKKDG